MMYVLIFLAGTVLGGVAGYGLVRMIADKAIAEVEGVAAERMEQLKVAKVDQDIVRAIRAGELGLDDLHEVGFENVRQEATGALVAAPPAEEEDPSEYMRFVKLPYGRSLQNIADMIPGDEVWIRIQSIRHDRRGKVRLRKDTDCTQLPTDLYRARLRFYGGRHEVGIDPNDPNHASGEPLEGGWGIEHTVVLRPEDCWGARVMASLTGPPRRVRKTWKQLT